MKREKLQEKSRRQQLSEQGIDIEILSLFPEYFTGPFDSSIIQKARQRGLLNIRHVQLRDFAFDKHKKVDDRPFGGGPGMVLKPEPVALAIQSVRRQESHVVYLSPQGSLLNAAKCQELAKNTHLILLCGHYEGIDERVIEQEVDEVISIGDYVLTNGAVGAIVLVDALARFVPGVLGHAESAEYDSFQKDLLDCSHYTRPENYKGMKVPQVLLEGDHAAIAEWRRESAMQKTQASRPDLYVRYLAKKEDKGLEESSKESELLESVLFVSNLAKSLSFYKKALFLETEQMNDERGCVYFGEGKLTLIQRESVAKAPSLLKVVVRDRQKFELIVRQLIRMGRHLGELQKLSEEDSYQLPFTDPDGYHWMAVFFKREKEKLWTP